MFNWRSFAKKSKGLLSIAIGAILLLFIFTAQYDKPAVRYLILLAIALIGYGLALSGVIKRT